MRNLIWKEWHEQSWKLAFSSIVLTAVVVIGLHSRIIADETVMLWVCSMALVLLPVMASTGLIPAERAEGSFESLIAMPIAPWRIVLAKTVMGMLMCIGPMLVAAIASVALAGGREIYRSSMIELYGLSMLANLSLFIWMLALTARLPSEARAGLVAMGIFICWTLATVGLWRSGGQVAAVSPLVYLQSWLNPPDDELVNGVWTQVQHPQGWLRTLAVLLQLVVGGLLWIYTVKSIRHLGGRNS